MYLSKEIINKITMIQVGYRDPWYSKGCYDFIDIYTENHNEKFNTTTKKRFKYDRIQSIEEKFGQRYRSQIPSTQYINAVNQLKELELLK